MTNDNEKENIGAISNIIFSVAKLFAVFMTKTERSESGSVRPMVHGRQAWDRQEINNS